MEAVGHHAGLAAGEADRGHAEIGKRHAHQGHADALTRRYQHVEFTAIGSRAYLISHLDQLVGGFAHGGDDRYDTMTTAMQVGETARNRANFRRCFKTDTAIFLYDDGMVAHLTSVRSLARLVHRTDTAYPCADDFKVRIEGDKVRAVSGRDPSKLGLKAQK